jgi:hypothetical protein
MEVWLGNGITNLEMTGEGIYDLVGADMSEKMDATTIGRLEYTSLKSPVRIEFRSCPDWRAKDIVDI